MLSCSFVGFYFSYPCAIFSFSYSFADFSYSFADFSCSFADLSYFSAYFTFNDRLTITSSSNPASPQFLRGFVLVLFPGTDSITTIF